MTRPPVRLLPALVLLGALLVAACGGGAKDVFDEPVEPSKLAVRLEEYKFLTKPTEVTTAVTRVVAQNTGTVTHDIWVLRTDLAADSIPIRDSMLDQSKVEVVAKATEMKRRDKATLEVKLQPGSYVLFCNVSGHYGLGMRSTFKVTAAAAAAP